MENTPSVAKMRLLLNRLLRATGTPVKAATVCSFTRAVVKVLPWFIEGGDLSRENWHTVGRELRAAKVEETVLRMWYLVDNTLATDSETIGQLLDEGLKILEKIGKDSKDSSSKDSEEESGAGGGTPSKKSVPPSDISPPLYPPLPSVPPYPEDSPHCRCLASSAPQWRPVVLGSGRTAVKEKGRAMTPVDPEEEERDSPVGRGIQSRRGPILDWSQFYKPQQIFLVFIDQQGNRGWTLVDFKLLKELQQAVQLYGPHANFTKAVLEGMGLGGLIVEDWRNIVKAVLSGGDYLLWTAAYGELAKKQALVNRTNRQPAWNEDMLTGNGAFDTEDAQARCPNEVLMQFQVMALRAWKVVPKKGEIKHSLTKIIQGPNEPYADFINRLFEAVGNLFESMDEAAPLLRRLAYEQANKTCRMALRP
uniref:Uncharacterized protein n=1 Tax=Oryctolagus cuniculus TaxID=9986 RepID=A0A5F9D659_RABIT